MAGTEAGPDHLYHFSRIYQIELKSLSGDLLLATGDWQKKISDIHKKPVTGSQKISLTPAPAIW
jgi:hypothetical protein